MDQRNIDQHLHTHICLIKYEQKWVKWFQDNNRRGCFIKNGFPRLGSLPFCTGFTKWKLQESIGSVVVWVICVYLLAISRLICQPLIPGRLGKLLCQAIYTLMSSSKSKYIMGGTWLCNVSLMSPIFAFITVFLESLGSLHIFAILGSILPVGGSRRGMVPAFLDFQIAAGDRSCFIFSDQDRCLY